MLRLTPDGTPDPTFDGDGVRVFPDIWAYRSGDSGPLRVLPDSDGGVHVLGVQEVAKLGATAQPDFASGTADWVAGAGGMFGVCLRAIGAGAGTDGTTWSRDSVDSDCADGNADPWRAIPASTGVAATKVAFRSTPGTTSAQLRFGFRTASNQPPGTYLAPVAIEVVAPTA